ncbi:MAG: DUF1036 domain-containing protein [Reyranellaceae bacterium]
MLRKLAIVCGAIGVMAISGGAQAQGFTVCNRSSVNIQVAKALNTGKKDDQGRPIIKAQGWYNFAQGECKVLWPGKLGFRYYLLFGQNVSANKEWKGDLPICVSRSVFDIEQYGLCPPDKYRKMFFQVDTGENESWTQNLRD